MNKNNLLFIGVVVVLGLALIFYNCFFKTRSKRWQDILENEIEEIETVTKEDYERSVKEIMSGYFSDDELSDDQRLSLLIGIREKVLEQHVPLQYKDLHLSLVISLDMIIDGISVDKEKTKEGEEKILKLVKTYPWLK